MHVDVPRINDQLKEATSEEIVLWAHKTFAEGLILTSSFDGDAAVMLHMVTRIIPSVRIIFLETGEKKEMVLLEEMKRYFNLNPLIYKTDGVTKKAEVLNQIMKSLGTKAWFSGVRADQTDHRATLDIVTMRRDGIYKIHPILKWTNQEIALYFRMWDLPFNPSKENDRHLKGECGIHTSHGDGENM